MRVVTSGAVVALIAAFAAAGCGTAHRASPPTEPTLVGSSTKPTTSVAKTIFSVQGCAACHTLTAAGATGDTGPDLDKLPAEAKQAGKPLDAFIRESITNPDAYIQPGFPRGDMPQDYRTVLSKPQLDSLVQFLISASKDS